jgi:hypothetical protein
LDRSYYPLSYFNKTGRKAAELVLAATGHRYLLRGFTQANIALAIGSLSGI